MTTTENKKEEVFVSWSATGKTGHHAKTGEPVKEYEKYIGGEPTGERMWMNNKGEYRGD